MAGSPPPSKIMIIRHAEKPPNPPNKTGPWDVQLDGKTGDGKSLIVQGWQRAGALSSFFAPYKSKPVNPEIVMPHHIYAANPKGETQRPWETVTPLAAWLKYKQGSSQLQRRLQRWRRKAPGEERPRAQQSGAYQLGAPAHHAGYDRAHSE